MLRRLARAGESLVAATRGQQQGKMSLSDMAARAGYADQAHLSRDARAVVGASPRELATLAQTDESH